MEPVITKMMLTRDDLEALAAMFGIETRGRNNAAIAQAIIIAMDVERILAA
jgi:hypothetical protein